VLTVSDDPQAFDSYRVDDACLLVRDGAIWLYYKGRGRKHGQTGPRHTRMGVAVAPRPDGPFVKQAGGEPVQDSGHEVQIWKHGDGVMSLVSPTGPNGRSLQYAADGLRFHVLLGALAGLPKAPGLFRPELVDPDAEVGQADWGICMASYGGDPYLARFQCVWNVARSSGLRAVGYDEAPPVGKLRFDFETGDAQGWQVVQGNLPRPVSDRPCLPRWPHMPFNCQGKFHLSTLETDDGVSDALVGVIQSPVILLRGEKMSFLLGGGNHEDVYAALCDASGRELMRAGGTNSPLFRRVNWDVSKYMGQRVRLRMVDRRKSGWAHITLDDFSTDGVLVDTPAVP
jgi:hypothetical protein